MNEILSQNEVDALLSAVKEGDLAEDGQAEQVEQAQRKAGRKTEEIKAFDLTSQNRVLKGKMPLLELINDRFIRAFRSTLSVDLRKVVDIECQGTRQIKYGEYLNSLPIPSCVNIFSMEPLRGHGLTILESNFVYVLIDLLCGGLGSARAKVEGREFTSIELKLVNRIVIDGLRDFQDAWSQVYPLSIKYQRTEINPQFVSIAPPENMVLVTSYVIDIEGSSGKVEFVTPYSTLEPIREKLQGAFIREAQPGDEKWRNILRGHLNLTKVKVVTEMGNTWITVRDMLELKTGDVLQLDIHAYDDVPVAVADKYKFKGQLGITRGYKAIQITE